MNKPENLKAFLNYFGHPVRSYSDVMEELGLFTMEK
jgi:hypothetical protein